MINQKAHQKLSKLADKFRQTNLKQLFNHSPQRGDVLSAQLPDVWLNYSRNLIDESVIQDLFALADECQLNQKIQALFAGEPINTSENRTVQHMLLRAPLDKSNSNSVAVHQQLDKIAAVVEKISKNQLISDTKITDVVCIGIGGSELGPKLLDQAFSASIEPNVKLHFVGNIDGACAHTTMRNLNKESTLFVITSKTFTTAETTTNFLTFKKWFTSDLSEQAFMDRSFAITANPEQAIKQGFSTSNIFQFWDWVGGRFSIWSSVGLPIAMAYGMKAFRDFLAGGHQMDKHFRTTNFEHNLPALLGLLHVWQSNYLGYPTRAVIPYAEHLEKLPAYLQQLEMESLGKSVDKQGNDIDYTTCPIVWGAAGTTGQHAFFQLLHQGTQIVPIDFIAVLEPDHDLHEHHTALLANCLAQSQSLSEGGDIGVDGHGQFRGNRPSNFILINRLSPYCLGELLAMYEHKVFVQAAIWDINAFDQWGVELGKRMANQLLADNQGVFSFDDIKTTFNPKG